MRDRPFVTANFAITVDGRISTRNLTPANFSSKRDKRRLVEIRAKCDAVMASAKTIAADNMTIGLPAEELRAARVEKGMAPYPTRVLLTNSGRISPELRLFTKDFSPIVIFSTEQMPSKVREALAEKAALHLHGGEQVNLIEMMRTLRNQHDVKRLVCEGGAQIFRALLEAELIDELNLTITPRIFGGKAAPTLTGLAGKHLAAGTRLKLREFSPIEGECFLRYTVAG
jgi:2,5-diamino-6-(ribosylamino)-4(3H)-pyrimidinone 5'-phosphate reductase